MLKDVSIQKIDNGYTVGWYVATNDAPGISNNNEYHMVAFVALEDALAKTKELFG